MRNEFVLRGSRLRGPSDHVQRDNLVTPQSIDPFGILFSSVSCSSSAFCVAVGSDGDEISYNGSAWTTLTNMTPLVG